MEYAITIENLSKQYERYVAVDNLSIKVKKGAVNHISLQLIFTKLFNEFFNFSFLTNTLS